MTPVNRALSLSRSGNANSSPSSSPSESKLSSLTVEDDARMSSAAMSDSLSLSLPLPKIPSYLTGTAYGERFYSFLEQEDGISGDIYMNPNYPKNSGAAAAAAYLKNVASTTSGGSSDTPGGSFDDEHRHLNVSASEFNLPQIFPSRRAAELDALGMWQYPRPPGSSGESSIDSYMRATGRRIYRDGNLTIIDTGTTRISANGNTVIGGSTNGNNASNTGSASSNSNTNTTVNTTAATTSTSAPAQSSNSSNPTPTPASSLRRLTTSSSSSSSMDLTTYNSPSSSSKPPLSTPRTNNLDSIITPRKDIGLAHLPTRWTKTDVDQNVAIDNDGTRIDYSSNASKSSSSSSSIHNVVVLKTDYPIPPLCGIFYYEVEAVEHGVEEFISVGFCDIEAGLTKVPGLDSRTWGYHGDDGRISAGQSPSKNFGPKIGVGDILGCGINFSKNSIFYTKNGLPLGTAFQDVKGVLFPCIGLKGGEIIHTNFGYEEFRFDIEKYVDGMKKKVLSQIHYSKAPSSMIEEITEDKGDGNDESKGWGFIKDLVASYFDHVGYVETAKAFEKERKTEEKAINFDEDDSSISSKMEIDNDNDDDESNQDEDKKKLKLDILNRQRIRSYIIDEDIDGALKLLNVFYPTVLEDNYLIKFKLLCRKFVSLVRKSIPSEENSSSPGLSSSSSAPPPSRTHRDYLNSAIQYGQDLRKEYKNDSSLTVTATLSTIFSLLAYEDPGSSPELSYILSKEELVPLAEELNSAILVSQGKPAVPSLQKLAEHTTQLVWELSDQGYNTASLLNVKSDFLDS